VPEPAAPTTLVGQVAAALDDADRCAAPVDLATRRRALMYAEAIDDADEADAVLRFGPRLRACLEPLGVDVDVAA
jgi:hypothetical protein